MSEIQQKMSNRVNQNLYGLGDYNTEQIKVLARVVEMEELNPMFIFYRRPDAHPGPNSFIFRIPIDEVSYIVPDSFAGEKGIDLAANLTIGQLMEIGSNSEEYLRETIKLKLFEGIKRNSQDQKIKSLLDYVISSPAWQI